jgi:diguanylate cyclase (GGDEF)-like protein
VTSFGSSLRRIGSAIAGPIALRAALIAAMLTLPVVAPGLNPITELNDRLVAKRFEWAPREASGKIAFVAIDKRTLDEVGVWPWPRSIYATLLDKLVAADAADIFFDIDFSTPSNAADDGALASALERAGGGVLLPIFRQQVAASSTETVVTKPIPSLLFNAWPVFANVSTDADGLVRKFDLGNEFDGVPTPSAPSSLSGDTGTSGRRLIDFSIRPGSVPTYSLADVLSGKVAAGQLGGRSVVVGASATELKDIFPVPVNGALAGPLIHVLAAETLIQNRLMTEFDQMPLELFLAAGLIVAVLSSRSMGLTKLLLLAVGAGTICEVAAFILQEDFAIITGTVVPWLLLALSGGLALNERIDLGQMVATLANIDARNTRRLMRQIITDSSDGIVAFAGDMKIAEISESAKSILRVSAGADLLSCAEPSVTAVIGDLAGRYDAEPGRIYSTVVEFVRHEGEVEVAYQAAITLSPVEEQGSRAARSFGGCIIIRDVTARRAYEAKLKRMAEEDELTGLLNRREFLARLEGRGGVVSVLDIERFSDMCATLGRDVGDTLLKAVAARLAASFPGDLLARIDGDLFAILRAEEDVDPGRHAGSLLAVFEEPVVFGEIAASVSVCLGVARAGLDRPESTLRAAESALDIAKKTSGRWSMYDPAVALQQARSRRLEFDMRNALRDGQFFLLYQPQVDLASGRFVGAEALLRWRHPELGLMAPTEFIPIAESSGMICDIGRWVLMEACAEAMLWPEGVVSVNVSPIQFERSDVESEVRWALSTSGLPASRLCLELTESAFLEDGGRSTSKMAALRAAGVSLALDDFGTGYSSMSYLADLPLDKLKIDQSFVRRMAADQGVFEIVKAIVALAHGLDLEIVAEGVEGAAEQALLRELQCETGQGYLFGKPQLGSDLLSLACCQKSLRPKSFVEA